MPKLVALLLPAVLAGVGSASIAGRTGRTSPGCDAIAGAEGVVGTDGVEFAAVGSRTTRIGWKQQPDREQDDTE